MEIRLSWNGQSRGRKGTKRRNCDNALTKFWQFKIHLPAAVRTIPPTTQLPTQCKHHSYHLRRLLHVLCKPLTLLRQHAPRLRTLTISGRIISPEHRFIPIVSSNAKHRTASDSSRIDQRLYSQVAGDQTLPWSKSGSPVTLIITHLETFQALVLRTPHHTAPFHFHCRAFPLCDTIRHRNGRARARISSTSVPCGRPSQWVPKPQSSINKTALRRCKSM